MPSLAHEILIVRLRERPELLSTLLRALGLPPLPEGLSVADGALRRTEPVELRPDLVLTRGADGPWVLVEVQRDPDPSKQRRWPLAAALLLDERGTMGDIVVLTSQRSVADWAKGVAVVSGPLGTSLQLVPTVVLLSGETVGQLLSEDRPELAFFAAFAMHQRHGAEARRVVTRALELVARLPPELQQAQTRAIFSVLSQSMLAWLREEAMATETEIESPYVRAWREELEARGAARALLAVLAARGFAVDEAVRARVMGTKDAQQLDRWVGRAVNAATLAEIFAD